MRVLGLFSGIGGFELGLQRAGMHVVKLCEIEDHLIRSLNKNFPSVPVHTDIEQLTVHEGEFDLMCGGFPCQDISIAGKNKGLLGGDKSSLWRQYLRLIEQGRPKYALIENVSALLGRGLETVLQDIAEVGYDATWTTLDSKYFGVPQRRRRVYVLAVRDGIAPDADILQFGQRDNADHRAQVDDLNGRFAWNFTTQPRVQYPFAYFTRQRSDQFAEIGLSGTLAKRDYKSYTDLVVHNNEVRRVSYRERLLLQGFPVDWLDGLNFTQKQLYSSNGMTVHVVEWLGYRVLSYDKHIQLRDD